eukprot:gene12183-11973_t
MNHEQNNDEKKYPGYPHYPAREDITRAGNNTGKVRMDPGEKEEKFNDTTDERDGEAAIVSGTDADVTKEDLELLDYADQDANEPQLQRASLDNTDADGDPLNEVSSLKSDVSGSDLDVPGAESDDDNEAIGEEDEENNYYSLGGDKD